MNPLVEGLRSGIKLAFDGTILDWATDHVCFPNSDRASKFDSSIAPWLNAPLLAVSDDEATQVFVRAPTGGGKTTMMETLACFIVAQKPGPTLFVGQTDDMVKDWTESRLLPIFNECQPVRDLFPEDRHALRKTTILFPHMVLFAGGANMTNLQEKSMRYCIGDEVWRWKNGMIKELKARHHDRGWHVGRAGPRHRRPRLSHRQVRGSGRIRLWPHGNAVGCRWDRSRASGIQPVLGRGSDGLRHRRVHDLRAPGHRPRRRDPHGAVVRGGAGVPRRSCPLERCRHHPR